MRTVIERSVYAFRASKWPSCPANEPPTKTTSFRSSLRSSASTLRRCSLRRFALHLVEPSKFGLNLIDRQTEHPHRLVERVTDLAEHLLQRRLLTAKLVLQEL